MNPQPPTHAEFVRDRNQKIEAMLALADGSPAEMHNLIQDPDAFAKRHGVILSDEEIFGIKSSQRGLISVVRAGLTRQSTAFFDNNCGCP